MLQILITRLQEQLRDEQGATAVEYGIMVALIAAIIVGTVGLLGQEVLRAFQEVVNALPF